MPEPQLDRVFEDTPVLVAYLFGSHATGRAGRESDRDIAVLLAPGLSASDRGRWRLELIGRPSCSRRLDFETSLSISISVLTITSSMMRCITTWTGSKRS